MAGSAAEQGSTLVGTRHPCVLKRAVKHEVEVGKLRL